jgi:alpha-glucosidase
MVAPQLKKGNNRKVVVPNGVWVDEQGKKYEKGIYEIEVPLSRLPIFKRIG